MRYWGMPCPRRQRRWLQRAPYWSPTWCLLLLAVLTLTGAWALKLPVRVASTSDLQLQLAKHWGSSPLELVVSTVRPGASLIVDAPLLISAPAAAGPLVIRAADAGGESHVVLDCERTPNISSSSAVIISGSTAPITLSGFHVTGCNGSAITITDSAAVILQRMRFDGNKAGDAEIDAATEDAGLSGGAVQATDTSSVHILDSAFVDNYAAAGGAIAVSNVVGGLLVTGCSFTGNTASFSGGALSAQGTNVVVRHSTFERCSQSPSTSSTAQGGGAIAAMSGNVTLEGVLLANNSAINGGGAVYFSGLELNTLVLRDSNCSDNVAGLESLAFGGCLSLYQAHMVVESSLFFRNTAYGAGGAITSTSGLKSNISAAHFLENTATGDPNIAFGGAIYSEGKGSRMQLSNSAFDNNSAIASGGAIQSERQVFQASNVSFASNHARLDGGAIVCFYSDNCVLDAGSLFVNNTAVRNGGALWASTTKVMRLDSVFMFGSESSMGGGAYVEFAADATLRAVFLNENCAYQAGGGMLLLQSNVTVAQSTMFLNTAFVGGALAVVGGGLDIADSLFSNNSAPSMDKSIFKHIPLAGVPVESGCGGAIAVQQVPFFSISGSTFMDNKADVDGAALHVSDSALIIVSNSNFKKNKAARGQGGAACIITGDEGSASFLGVGFESNAATAGGALAFNTEYMGGQLDLLPRQCDITNCSFTGNSATQADGGAMVSAGPLALAIRDTTFTANTAAHNGGSICARGATSFTLLASNATNNVASAMGGLMHLFDCMHLNLTRLVAIGNKADAGGAAALLRSVSNTSTVADCSFIGNVAGALAQAAHAAGRIDASNVTLRLPLPNDCYSPGAGGALCLMPIGPLHLDGLLVRDNMATSGGGVFTAACLEPEVCFVSVANSNIINNTAFAGGGGAIYTEDAAALRLLLTAAVDTIEGLKQRHQQQLVQLASVNSAVGSGSYGHGVASRAARLVASSVSINSSNAIGEDPDTAAGARDTLSTEWLVDHQVAGVLNLYGSSSSPASSSSKQGGSTGCSSGSCGAVEADTVFSLSVQLVDGYGSVVATGLRPRNSSSNSSSSSSMPPTQGTVVIAQLVEDYEKDASLLGAPKVTFQGGAAEFSQLQLNAVPGSLVQLELDTSDARIQPLQVPLQVLPCSMSTTSQPDGTCSPCSSPTFSLDPYSTQGCSTQCPEHALCLHNAPIPASGAWHSHPRSAQMLLCPNAAACSASRAPLLAYQNATRFVLRAAALEVGAYMRAQCAEGYTGHLCGRCDSGAQDGGIRYGRGPGNACVACPAGGRAGAAMFFILARLLDVALVVGLAVVWLVVGSIAPQQLLQQHQLRQEWPDGSQPADVSKTAAWLSINWRAQVMLGTVQCVALLLHMDITWLWPSWIPAALSALIITPQNTLQWVSFECMLPSSSSGSDSSATVASNIFNTLYPILLSVVVSAVLVAAVKLQAQRLNKTIGAHPTLQASAASSIDTSDNTKGLPFTDSPHKQLDSRGSHPSTSTHLLAGLGTSWQGVRHLLALSALASMAYSFTLVAQAVMAPWWCIVLDKAPTVPGEAAATAGATWWAMDPSQQCWQGAHLSAVLVAAVIGLPLIVAYVLALVAITRPLKWRLSRQRQRQQQRQLQQQWQEEQQRQLRQEWQQQQDGEHGQGQLWSQPSASESFDHYGTAVEVVVAASDAAQHMAAQAAASDRIGSATAHADTSEPSSTTDVSASEPSTTGTAVEFVSTFGSGPSMSSAGGPVPSVHADLAQLLPNNLKHGAGQDIAADPSTLAAPAAVSLGTPLTAPCRAAAWYWPPLFECLKLQLVLLLASLAGWAPDAQCLAACGAVAALFATQALLHPAMNLDVGLSMAVGGAGIQLLALLCAASLLPRVSFAAVGVVAVAAASTYAAHAAWAFGQDAAAVLGYRAH